MCVFNNLCMRVLIICACVSYLYVSALTCACIIYLCVGILSVRACFKLCVSVNLARFHLAFLRDQRNWTNFWFEIFESLGPEKSRSQTCTLVFV